MPCGLVPRSCTGSLEPSALCKPWVLLLGSLGISHVVACIFLHWVSSDESVRPAYAHVMGMEARVQKVQMTCSQSQRVEPGPRMVPE